MKQFVWHPGFGVDHDALARLRAQVSRPAEPMGEAWFMSEGRRLFHELAGDLSNLSAEQLQRPLEEIASGASAFGPLQEWREWYHYLLPQLIPRSHEAYISSLLESLLTGFFALHPNGIGNGIYQGFEGHVLQTLGRCVMEPGCWDGSEIQVGSFLHRSDANPNRVWCWWDASGDFSASMFFCLKYLPVEQISGWLQSALRITSPHWRAQMLVWLLGADDMLRGRCLWPSEFQLDAYPSIGWAWSHCLRPELATSDESGLPPVNAFLPSESRCKALELLDTYFTDDVFLGWLDSIQSIPYLQSELANIPTAFERIYVRR